MPTYIFICTDCQSRYEDLVRYDPTGLYATVSCPKCASTNKENRIGTPYIMNTNSQNNIFDIAAGKNMERAKEERRTAETYAKDKNPFNFNESGDFDLGEGVHDPEFRSGLS